MAHKKAKAVVGTAPVAPVSGDEGGSSKSRGAAKPSKGGDE